nr:lyase family protein [Planosporangium thailandense]
MTGPAAQPGALTGRITGGPAAVLHDEVLAPQFQYELTHLLPRYVAIEKVLVVEYLRLGVLDEDDARSVGALLHAIGPELLAADRATNMSDIAFALERHVEEHLPRSVPRWHVDRSRNDLQACAQLMFGRAQLLDLAGRLRDFGRTARQLAGATRELPMPGYTHFQAAQVITPGFYLAAVSEQVQHTLRRLLATYDGIDACPLGAGAMSGQHLPWDRERMARLLGFPRSQPVALTAVASRGWVVELTAELSMLGVALSRFATDLLTWGGSEHGFIDLPDELSGISSAMPQKKNFPVLERIRGRTAHLTAYHLDAVLGQRNTPYANLVEVSKEAGANLLAACDTLRSVLRLFTAVLTGLTFRADRMRAACEREFLGGFTLATALTLNEGVPWRRAQVMAGRYVVAAVAAGLDPTRPDAALLGRIAAECDHPLDDPAAALAEVFDVDGALRGMRSAGSAHPDAVAAVLAEQEREDDRLNAQWAARSERVACGAQETDALLGLSDGTAG